MTMTAALIASGVGTLMSAVGTIASGSAQAEQARAQSEAAAYNAAMQRAQAENERTTAKIEAQDRRKEGEAIMAAQRARIGAAGVTTEGTPLLIGQDTREQVETNAIRTIYGGEIRGRALEQGARLSDMQAASASRAASSALSNAYLSAGGSLLTGLGRMGTSDSFRKWWDKS